MIILLLVVMAIVFLFIGIILIRDQNDPIDIFYGLAWICLSVALCAGALVLDKHQKAQAKTISASFLAVHTK